MAAARESSHTPNQSAARGPLCLHQPKRKAKDGAQVSASVYRKQRRQTLCDEGDGWHRLESYMKYIPTLTEW